METIRILLLEDDAPTRQRLHDALAADPGFSVEAEVYTETATFAKAMLIFTER